MLLLKYGQTATITGRALSSVHQHVVRTRMVSFTSRYSAQQRQILASRQKLMAIASRLISREMPRLPLDAESLSAMVTKDFLCWLNVALFINLVDPVAVENTGKPQKNVSSWMDRFYVEHRTKMAAACFGLGCFVLLYSLGYPLRTVSRLTLLKGGNQLSVTTYSHFGRTRHFTVPLDDVSCKKSRMSSPAHASMKIRGRWLYFLLDTRDGRFHEPELFDYVIGLSRSFK